LPRLHLFSQQQAIQCLSVAPPTSSSTSTTTTTTTATTGTKTATGLQGKSRQRYQRRILVAGDSYTRALVYRYIGLHDVVRESMDDTYNGTLCTIIATQDAMKYRYFTSCISKKSVEATDDDDDDDDDNYYNDLDGMMNHTNRPNKIISSQGILNNVSTIRICLLGPACSNYVTFR
jgi:hypothetical protein